MTLNLFSFFPKATSSMETSLDDSDVTDYSDCDYVPDLAGSSSEPDEDTPLYPVAKKPLSLCYRILSPSKPDIDSGSPERDKRQSSQP